MLFSIIFLIKFPRYNPKTLGKKLDIYDFLNLFVVIIHIFVSESILSGFHNTSVKTLSHVCLAEEILAEDRQIMDS